MTAVLMLVGVAAGAVTMRVTGIGMNLVAAPFIVLAVGPWNALGVLHLLGLFTCVMLTVQLWNQVDRRRAVVLGCWALPMVVPGTWLALVAPPDTLQVVIGVGLLFSLLLMVGLGSSLPHRDGHLTRAVVGSSCGLFTFTAGLGGPPLVIYSRLARWDHVSFVATIQPFFVALGVAALIGRQGFSGSALPDLSVLFWALALVTVFVSLWAGDKLAKRVRSDIARRLVLALAFAGSLVTIAGPFV